MHEPWQCYTFGTKVFNFLSVPVLGVGGLDAQGFVEEWPLNIAGVTQLHSNTQFWPQCTQQNKSGHSLNQILNGGKN